MELKITYGITVKNELEEIKNLLPFLIKNVRKEDDIVVLWDSSDGTDEMVNYLTSLEDDISLYQDEFQGHFADWKNKLTSHCFGDYIFQIDADEYPEEYLMNHIDWVIDNNPNVDIFWVPRINKVNGLTQEHIDKWGWKVDPDGRVNFPDYQCRILKNTKEIKWKNKVHEVLTGYKNESHLPANDEYCIHHLKDIKRQEQQNEFYNKL
jgi:hypothetical protein